MNATDVVRHQQAVLAALLAAHGQAMPVRVCCDVSEAADELLDPLALPDLVPADELHGDDPKATLHATILALRHAIPHADAAAALACGRAVRRLRAAAGAWSES